MRERRAADCRYLRYEVDAGSPDGPIVSRCSHRARDGFACVGPFLDEMPTTCGLWEEQPRNTPWRSTPPDQTRRTLPFVSPEGEP